MGDEEEAKTLIVMSCSMHMDGKYYARELEREQTLENLEVFSKKLKLIHDKYIKGTPRCKCVI